MKTIDETIQAILDEQHECRWMDTSDLEVYLRKVTDKQKAIDIDKVSTKIRNLDLRKCVVGGCVMTDQIAISVRKAMEDSLE